MSLAVLLAIATPQIHALMLRIWNRTARPLVVTTWAFSSQARLFIELLEQALLKTKEPPDDLSGPLPLFHESNQSHYHPN